MTECINTSTTGVKQWLRAHPGLYEGQVEDWVAQVREMPMARQFFRQHLQGQGGLLVFKRKYAQVYLIACGDACVTLGADGYMGKVEMPAPPLLVMSELFGEAASERDPSEHSHGQEQLGEGAGPLPLPVPVPVPVPAQAPSAKRKAAALASSPKRQKQSDRLAKVLKALAAMRQPLIGVVW